jgi:hypothetical protein
MNKEAGAKVLVQDMGLYDEVGKAQACLLASTG